MSRGSKVVDRAIWLRHSLLTVASVAAGLIVLCSSGQTRRDPPKARVAPSRASGLAKPASTAQRVTAPTVGPVLSADQDVLSELLRRLQPRVESDLPACIHALHCLGRDATVPTRSSGEAKRILELVLNSDASRSHFGGAQAPSTTRYGARFPRYVGAFLGANQSASEAHPGQLLSVLGELSVPLGQAIHVSKDGAANLQIVLDDLIANFVLEGEIYWDVAALAFYLPPSRSWKNKFGEGFTFDAVVEKLLAQPPGTSSCGDTHRLITLTLLLRADTEAAILSAHTRHALSRHLAETTSRLEEVQAPEGYWRIDWNAPAEARSSETSRPSVDMTSEILVTGHHLEWLMLIPVEIQPPHQDTIGRAARWLLAELLRHSQDAEWVAHWYCPASHAARAILLLSKPTAKPSPNEATARGPVSMRYSGEHLRVASVTQNGASRAQSRQRI